MWNKCDVETNRNYKVNNKLDIGLIIKIVGLLDVGLVLCQSSPVLQEVTLFN